MRSMNRRTFVQTGTSLLGATLTGGLLAACGRETATPEEAVEAAAVSVPWRYSLCNEILREPDDTFWDWERQCRYTAEKGYTGLEVAPFTLADHVDEISADRRAEMVQIARNHGVDILGLHWLLVTPTGLHAATPDDALFQQTWEYVAKLGDLCADLGGRVMIFGSPAQRSTWMPAADGERTPLDITKEQAMDRFAEGCAMIGDRLADRGVQLLVEPLSSDQTDVVNTLAEARYVVDQANHPAISAMFDFHNTADETEPLDQLVREYHPEYIKHIQIQEMDGTYMGTGDGVTAFVPALQAFLDEGYDGWISLEVFDFTPGPETISTVSMETYRKMEAQLRAT